MRSGCQGPQKMSSTSVLSSSSFLLLLAIPPAHAAPSPPTPPACNYNPGIQWTELPLGVHVMPCAPSSGGDTTDKFQQWAGETLQRDVASALTNAGTPGYALGAEQRDPVTMKACGPAAPGASFRYNHTARTLGVAGSTSQCLNVNHDTGPDVNFERCPVPGISPPRVQARRQFDWDPRTSQLRSVFEPGLCTATSTLFWGRE